MCRNEASLLMANAILMQEEHLAALIVHCEISSVPKFGAHAFHYSKKLRSQCTDLPRFPISGSCRTSVSRLGGNRSTLAFSSFAASSFSSVFNASRHLSNALTIEAGPKSRRFSLLYGVSTDLLDHEKRKYSSLVMNSEIMLSSLLVMNEPSRLRCEA